MIVAVLAKIIHNDRSLFYDLLATFFFAVKGAKRACPRSSLTLLAKLFDIFLQKILKFLFVFWPATWTTDAVYLERKISKPQGSQNSPCKGYNKDILERIFVADNFHSDLIKLPVPSGLRPFVPKHRTCI